MRVLFLMNTFPPGYTGGAEVSAYHTCRELIRKGLFCSVLVVNNQTRSSADEHYTLDSIPVHRVQFSTFWRPAWKEVLDRRIYRTIRSELKRVKPDLVHIHNVSGATLAAHVACRVAGVPVVNTLHDLWLLCPNNMLYRQDGSFCDPAQTSKTCNQCFRRYTFWGNIPYRRAVFAALTSNVKAFISPSQALIDLHIKAGYAPNRFRLIPYGIPAEVTSSPYHVGVRKFVASSHNYHNLVFAGGGVEIKGAHVLIQAIPLMMRHIENLRIAIAGGGERKYLSQFHQYGPTIHRLGPVPFNEMRTLFAAADLTLVPSVWFENSPVVIYENFHVGTPVVGSAFGGIPELIHERETGYLCSVGDPVTLAEKVILHFARSAQERRQMRHHCVETVRTDFSMNRHIEGTLRHYHEILSQ